MSHLAYILVGTLAAIYPETPSCIQDGIRIFRAARE
jgi:hypothetical protein